MRGVQMGDWSFQTNPQIAEETILSLERSVGGWEVSEWFRYSG